MRPRLDRVVAVVLCCVAVAALQLPDALAQKASNRDAQSARKHFKRGRAHHDLGNYEKAVKEYLRSYELSGAPRLLFNVAQAYRLKGDRARAVEYYEKYLAAEPRGELADVARGQIEALRREQAEGETSRAERARLAEEARHWESKARRAEEARQAEEARRHKEARRAAEAEKAKHQQELLLAEEAREATAHQVHARRLRSAGLAIGAVGLAALAGGAAYGLRAHSIASELEGLPEWEPEHQTRYDQGERANRNMLILYSMGVAALTGGGVLYYLSRERTGASETSAPVLGISAQGVSVSMRF